MDSPVFILGTQRSGTTLLTRVLSAHPDIFIKNELNTHAAFKPENSKEQALEEIKRQISNNFKKPFDEVVANKKVWGFKDPELTVYIHRLQEFIPDSKFIIIVRDPRGTVNSYIHNKWGLGTNAYIGALRWNEELDEQLQFLEKYPDNTILIRYEDLVIDMESAIRKVCDHLGLTFDESMLDYHNQSANYKVRAENIHTHQKPDKKLSDKWRAQLSEFEIGVIEKITGDKMKRLDYEAIGKPISPNALQILYFKLHQKILGEIQIQYKRRRTLKKRISRKFKRMFGLSTG